MKIEENKITGKGLGEEFAFPHGNYEHFGCTKREYIATMAMQGLIASGKYLGEDFELTNISESGVQFADALLNELAISKTSDTYYVEDAMVDWLTNRSEEEANEPYIHTLNGTFSMNEIAKEIRGQTVFGKQMVSSIVKLAVDLIVRNKEKINMSI